MAGRDQRKRDAENRLTRITKTCTVKLVGNDGTRLPVGDFTLTEPDPGPTLDQFADEAWKSARASLSKLMAPQWRLVVIDGQREQGYGFDRWIRLVDGREDLAKREQGKGSKLPIHKKAAV